METYKVIQVKRDDLRFEGLKFPVQIKKDNMGIVSRVTNHVSMTSYL